MPTYTFADTFVAIYHIEADSYEEAQELAAHADAFNLNFEGTDLVAIDGNPDYETER